jgi:hypothetical protein
LRKLQLPRRARTLCSAASALGPHLPPLSPPRLQPHPKAPLHPRCAGPASQRAALQQRAGAWQEGTCRAASAQHKCAPATRRRAAGHGRRAHPCRRSCKRNKNRSIRLAQRALPGAGRTRAIASADGPPPAEQNSAQSSYTRHSSASGLSPGKEGFGSRRVMRSSSACRAGTRLPRTELPAWWRRAAAGLGFAFASGRPPAVPRPLPPARPPTAELLQGVVGVGGGLRGGGQRARMRRRGRGPRRAAARACQQHAQKSARPGRRGPPPPTSLAFLWEMAALISSTCREVGASREIAEDSRCPQRRAFPGPAPHSRSERAQRARRDHSRCPRQPRTRRQRHPRRPARPP